MKYIVRKYFLVIPFLWYHSEGLACNLTSLSLTSITGTGPYTITTRLCVGYGRTGSVRGADADTRTFAFAFYSSNPTSITINSFSPSSVTSARGFSNCTMSGSDIGAVGTPLNSQATIAYADPGTAPCTTQPFGCISTTASCGNVGQQCINFTFVTNVLPDSIRVFGTEGNGNFVAGCSYNADMLINFSGLLPVFWGSTNAKWINKEEVKVDWVTLSEVRNYFFTIEKTDALVEGMNHHGQQQDMSVWTQCYLTRGTNTNNIAHYSFTDKEPFPGVSYYRIKQTDFDGTFSYSRIMLVNAPEEDFAVKVYPNPASDKITIESESIAAISIIGLQGEKMYEEILEPEPIHFIETKTWPRGLYLLRLIKNNGDNHSLKIRLD